MRKKRQVMSARRAVMVTTRRRKAKNRTNLRRKNRMRSPLTMATATQCRRCVAHHESSTPHETTDISPLSFLSNSLIWTSCHLPPSPLLKLPIQTQKPTRVRRAVHKDKELDSDIEFEDGDDEQPRGADGKRPRRHGR
jgi:hypothetical protein